ncbi:MAG: hypothetical protein ABSF94_10885 [Steroidobacteraceae bacterium]
MPTKLGNPGVVACDWLVSIDVLSWAAISVLADGPPLTIVKRASSNLVPPIVVMSLSAAIGLTLVARGSWSR